MFITQRSLRISMILNIMAFIEWSGLSIWRKEEGILVSMASHCEFAVVLIYLIVIHRLKFEII
jgi:hypothetical protein